MSFIFSEYIILRPTVKGVEASDLKRRASQTESNPHDSSRNNGGHDNVPGDIQNPGCLVCQVFRQFVVTGRPILSCWAYICWSRASHHQTPIAQVIWGMHRCTSADNKQTADGNQSLHIASLSNIEDDILSYIAKLSVLIVSFVYPARKPISPVDRQNGVHLRQKVELL